MKKLEKLQKEYSEVEALVYGDRIGLSDDEVFDLCERLETLSDKIAEAKWNN